MFIKIYLVIFFTLSLLCIQVFCSGNCFYVVENSKTPKSKIQLLSDQVQCHHTLRRNTKKVQLRYPFQSSHSVLGVVEGINTVENGACIQQFGQNTTIVFGNQEGQRMNYFGLYIDIVHGLEITVHNKESQINIPYYEIWESMNEGCQQPMSESDSTSIFISFVCKRKIDEISFYTTNAKSRYVDYIKLSGFTAGFTDQFKEIKESIGQTNLNLSSKQLPKEVEKERERTQYNKESVHDLEMVNSFDTQDVYGVEDEGLEEDETETQVKREHTRKARETGIVAEKKEPPRFWKSPFLRLGDIGDGKRTSTTIIRPIIGIASIFYMIL